MNEEAAVDMPEEAAVGVDCGTAAIGPTPRAPVRPPCGTGSPRAGP